MAWRLQMGAAMRVVFWVAIFLAGGTAGSRAEQRLTAEFPFEYHDGLLWISVEAAGADQSLSFLLDSGAAVSAFDVRTAKRLGLRLGKRVAVRAVRTSVTAHWTMPVVPLRVDSLSLGGKFLALDFSQLSRACARRIDGLLGADFFRDRVVQLDYARRRVRVFTDSPRRPATAETLPIRWRRGALCVPVSVDGDAARWARLDTGCAKPLHWVAGLRHADPLCSRLRGDEAPKAFGAPARDSAARACAVTRGEATATPAGHSGAATGARVTSMGLTEVAVPVALKSVTLGRARFDAVPVGLHAREIFRGEAGLLGNGLLSRFRVTVDGPAGCVILEKY